MNKKLLIVFIVTLFLFLFFTKDALAADEICSSSDTWMSWCKTGIGSPSNVCCRDSSCNTGSSRCGTISKWNFCYAYKCCAKYVSTCIYGGNDIRCYEYFRYEYTYKKCPVTDSCRLGTPYLYPGICLDSGCAKGGNYKICCKPDGSSCICQGGNNSGTCPSGCPNPGPNITTCPTGTTHKVCSGTSCVTVSGAGTNECSSDPECGPGPTSPPGPTSTPGPGPTSAPVGACNNCLDWGDGSNVAAWCACELLCTGRNVNPACTAAPTSAPPPTSCSARGGFCAYNGSCPTNKGYSNVGATSDCPGGCCACN